LYKETYKHASAQLEAINQTDGKVWLKPVSGTNPPFLPLSVRKTAIISLANLKGGVGKTTLTANLGAAFASEGMRVLLIDLDRTNRPDPQGDSPCSSRTCNSSSSFSCRH
jgi:Mrp family chromosome partitioning ATPase